MTTKPTTVDWRNGLPTWLAGRRITITTPQATITGTVERAAVGRFGQLFVEFTDGRSIDWQPDDAVTVEVTP